MNYAKLEDILRDYSFQKIQNKEQYFLITNVILDETNHNLVIYAKIKDDKIIFSDNSRFIDCYDYADIDIDYIIKNVIKPNLPDNMFIEQMSIKMIAEELRFGFEISDYIKTIVLLEDKIEALLYNVVPYQEEEN